MLVMLLVLLHNTDPGVSVALPDLQQHLGTEVHSSAGKFAKCSSMPAVVFPANKHVPTPLLFPAYFLSASCANLPVVAPLETLTVVGRSVRK